MADEMYFVSRVYHADAYCAGRDRHSQVFPIDEAVAVLHGMPPCKRCIGPGAPEQDRRKRLNDE